MPRPLITGSRSGEHPSRPLELLRGVWGLTLLTAPATALRLLDARAEHDHRALVVARVLGARQVVQAAWSGAFPTRGVLAVGAWVDAAHSLTGVALAVADPKRRRTAATDATVAAAFAVAGRRALARRPASPLGAG